LARKAIYKHATPVDANAYPDDGTSPVGTTEWNEDPAPQGMYGNTPTSATVTIDSAGLLTPTDSVTVATSYSGSSDAIAKIALANTNEYDLIYLFGNASHVVTLTHTASPSADGHVFTVGGADEILSVTKPTILMRKGVYWYGFGGGGASTPTDITVADTTDTTCFPALFESATGDLAPKTDAGLAYNAGTGVLTATGFAGPITGAVTGNVTGNASGTALTVTQAAQSAITSTGTLTGLTLSGALTGTDVVLSGRLKADKGADVASATAMTLGADGNTFDITGTTTIVTIPSTNWAVGNLIHLQFDGVLTVTHSSATDSILLGDQGNMTTAAGDVLSLFFNGTNWVEISRSSVSSGGGATIVHTFVNTTTTGYLGTASSFGTVGAGDRDIYIKKIDTYNEGVFTKIWKNGSAVEVQIA